MFENVNNTCYVVQRQVVLSFGSPSENTWLWQQLELKLKFIWIIQISSSQIELLLSTTSKLDEGERLT